MLPETAARRDRNVAEIGGAAALGVRIHPFRHAHGVVARLIRMAASFDIVSAGGGGGEGQPGVPADAAIVVPGARNPVAVGVVEASQYRVPQGATAAVGSLQVDDVGMAGDQVDREPVEVFRGLDLPSRRAAHRHRAGGLRRG